MYSDDFNNENIENNEMEENVERNNEQNDSKRKLIIIGVLVLIVILIVGFYMFTNKNGADKPTVIAPELIISSESVELALGNSIPLSAAVTNYQNASLVWTSSDENVAKVENGLVTAVGYGKAVVTVSYIHTDQVPYSKTCNVTVSAGDPNTPITNVTLPNGELLISVNGEYKLPVIVEPSNGYITNVKYESSNPSVVTVSNDGSVKALSAGKAVIKLDYNNGQFFKEVPVNVVTESVITGFVVPISSIMFKEDTLEKKVGDSFSLSYELIPSNASSDDLEWKSSNTSVVSISNGTCKALAEGTAQITVTAPNGSSDTITITITSPKVSVTGIKVLSDNPLNINFGGRSTISYAIEPSNATDKRVFFYSSDGFIAGVTQDGVVGSNKKGGVGSTKITIVALESCSKLHSESELDNIYNNKSPFTPEILQSCSVKTTITVNVY